MNQTTPKMTNYRWIICLMLFLATTVNYLDRQVLSLTWKDFIAPEFHWSNDDYGTITGLFSLIYAIAMLFAGRIVDWFDTKKGYLLSIGVWSVGACLHAFCGIATEMWVGVDSKLDLIQATGDMAVVISTVSVYFFIVARTILAIGEAGNFPAAVKATAEYFPKKDRGYATSIFNAGTTIGALVAPFTIPVLANKFGWEASFMIIGVFGFIWMGFWVFIYKKPEENPRVNSAELAYILSDSGPEKNQIKEGEKNTPEKKLSILQSFKYKQTWALMIGKFLTDGVWWFFLFWMPAYLSSVYDMPSSDPRAQWALGVLYAIVMLSIIGGYLPTIFVEKQNMDPYDGRMKAMLIFAFFPLLTLLAPSLGRYSYWFPVIIIGIACAAHQAWSANIFSTVGDMFPKSVTATIIGIAGMAGGVGAFLINKGSGLLFDFAEKTELSIFNFKGIESGYMIIFSICSVAYLLAWIIMKTLVPRREDVVIE
jgi:ACS family hexuronate transporter-like MFS transporter